MKFTAAAAASLLVLSPLAMAFDNIHGLPLPGFNTCDGGCSCSAGVTTKFNQRTSDKDANRFVWQYRGLFYKSGKDNTGKTVSFDQTAFISDNMWGGFPECPTTQNPSGTDPYISNVQVGPINDDGSDTDYDRGQWVIDLYYNGDLDAQACVGAAVRRFQHEYGCDNGN